MSDLHGLSGTASRKLLLSLLMRPATRPCDASHAAKPNAHLYQGQHTQRYVVFDVAAKLSMSQKQDARSKANRWIAGRHIHQPAASEATTSWRSYPYDVLCTCRGVHNGRHFSMSCHLLVLGLGPNEGPCEPQVFLSCALGL